MFAFTKKVLGVSKCLQNYMKKKSSFAEPFRRNLIANQEHINFYLFVVLHLARPPRCLSSRALASHTGDPGSIPGRDRHTSLKQVVIAPMPATGLRRYPL